MKLYPIFLLNLADLYAITIFSYFKSTPQKDVRLMFQNHNFPSDIVLLKNIKKQQGNVKLHTYKHSTIHMWAHVYYIHA